MALMTFQEAKMYLNEPHSCLKLVTARRHITLSPMYIGKVKVGVKEILNTELKLYSDSLNGVMVAYDNIKKLGQHGLIIGSQPWLHFDIQAEFIVFNPTAGSILKGVVNKIGKDHIGCLVHGCFNASLPRPRQSTDTWSGTMFSIGQEILFEVTKVHNNTAVVSTDGKLIPNSFPKTPKKSKRKAHEMLDNSADDLDSSHAGADKPHKKKRKYNEPLDRSLADAGKHSKEHEHNDVELLSADASVIQANTKEPIASSSGEDHKTKKHKKKKKHKSDKPDVSDADTRETHSSGAALVDVEKTTPSTEKDTLSISSYMSDSTYDSGVVDLQSDISPGKNKHKKRTLSSYDGPFLEPQTVSMSSHRKDGKKHKKHKKDKDK